MTTIVLASTESDCLLISQMAHDIWHEHYTKIIGKAQVDYMVEKFQSQEAIANQIEEGSLYYIINYSGSPVGYLCVKKNEDSLFLSKIYINKDYRGKKIGKSAMQFIEERAKELNCSKISLTVNKNNTNSIKAYEKIGFKNIGPAIFDIGNGFVMDDYKMEKISKS